MWIEAVIGSAIFALDRVLQAPQPGGPELGQEGVERLEPLGTDGVEPPLAVRPDRHERGPCDLGVHAAIVPVLTCTNCCLYIRRMTDTYTKRLALHAPRPRITAAVATLEGIRGWWTPIVAGSAAPGGELHLGFVGTDEHVVMRVEHSGAGVRWTCLEHTGAPSWRGSIVTLEPSDGALELRHDG